MALDMNAVGLNDLVEELNSRIEVSLIQSQVANILALGQVMSLDATNPTDYQKIVRHLANVEKFVRDGVT